MAPVEFTVEHHFDQSPQVVWDELVDWAAHANWIPATRIKVAPGDPLAVGAEFTAWTGYGPLTLEDRMRVAALEWDADNKQGHCTVDKLGPILTGSASFTVSSGPGHGAALMWVEDVVVKHLPTFLAPVAARIGAVGFKLGMRNLGRQLRKRLSS